MSRADEFEELPAEKEQAINATLLKREGYAVITAEDGFEALPKIVDYQPDRWDGDFARQRMTTASRYCGTSSRNVDGSSGG